MKTCAQCGITFARHTKEAFSHFARRRFCSKRCTGLALNPRKPPTEFAARYRKIKSPDGRHLLEHRYVMEIMLGRPLERHEQVHHINHDRLDNRPENLELVTSQEHGQRHTFRPITSECSICGTVFTPHKTKRGRKLTCSKPCQYAQASRTRRGA